MYLNHETVASMKQNYNYMDTPIAEVNASMIYTSI